MHLQAYALDYGTIFDVVSKIDTSKTVIYDYCPEYLKSVRCEPERYRNLEGLCNNLENPHWGAAMIAHSRSVIENLQQAHLCLTLRN